MNYIVAKGVYAFLMVRGIIKPDAAINDYDEYYYNGELLKDFLDISAGAKVYIDLTDDNKEIFVIKWMYPDNDLFEEKYWYTHETIPAQTFTIDILTIA